MDEQRVHTKRKYVRRAVLVMVVLFSSPVHTYTDHILADFEEQAYQQAISSVRSWLKKSFDACLKAWAEFDFLVQAPEVMGSFNRAAVVDASLCHVAYLGWCLEHLAEQELAQMHFDDVVYLEKMLAALEDLCSNAATSDESERLSCAHALLQNARKKLVDAASHHHSSAM